MTRERKVNHLGDRSLDAIMGVGDHQLHAAQTAPGELPEEGCQEPLGLGGADVQAEHFPAAIAVHTDRHRDDAPVPADLYVGACAAPGLGSRLSFVTLPVISSPDYRIFSSLPTASVPTESWRRHYNGVRPHASLGYCSPAPEVVMLSLTA